MFKYQNGIVNYLWNFDIFEKKYGGLKKSVYFCTVEIGFEQGSRVFFLLVFFMKYYFFADCIR